MNYKTKRLIGAAGGLMFVALLLTALRIKQDRDIYNEGKAKFVVTKNVKGEDINYDDLAISPNFDVGTVTDLWFDKYQNVKVIVKDITLADIGRLGEAFSNVDGTVNDRKIKIEMTILREER